MGADSFEPAQGTLKELGIRSSLYDGPVELAETFAHLVAGHFDVTPLVTDSVGLADVADAFDLAR